MTMFCAQHILDMQIEATKRYLLRIFRIFECFPGLGKEKEWPCVRMMRNDDDCI